MAEDKSKLSPHIHEKADDRHSKVTPDVKKMLDETEETGGPKGAEPTRFGDWEQNGRCTDF